MNLILTQTELVLLSKSILEGIYFGRSFAKANLSDNAKFLVGTILGAAGEEDISLLNSENRVIRAFKILHDEKSKNSVLTDDQFQYLRRAVGNGNYEKAFALLATYWRQADPEKQKAIAQAAGILGMLKKAYKYYHDFAKTLS